MKKIILTTLTLFILFAFSLVAILSTIGIETDKFNNLIIKKISQTNNKINLKIDKINFPKMVMHGDKDKIVPFSMGKEMFEKFSEPKLSYFRKDDDLMMEFDEELLEKIKNFLKII